jgi:epoxyqueuosine reductase
MGAPADASGVRSRLEAHARDLGFTLFGISKPDASAHMSLYGQWLAEGRHGEMAYLGREDSVARRADLRLTMDDVRSVVVVGQEYYAEDEPETTADPSRAIVARYARGDDYHEVVKKKLLALLASLDGSVEGGVAGRAYVDTGPILERDLARRAGLGWFGKNTMLISPTRGSYFFLGLLLVDIEIDPSGAFADDRCGTCSSCLEACPTGALLGRDASGAPVMDATRCISYLTIELRGPVPRQLRSGIGNRVFGCDICQEVCPWNVRFAEPSAEVAFSPREGLDLPPLTALAAEVLALDEEGFRARFRRSPIKRAKREGLLRNLCVALGNELVAEAGHPDDAASEVLSVLERALSDAHPLVRGHAAWALGRSRHQRARTALSERLDAEADEWVVDEVRAALSG